MRFEKNGSLYLWYYYDASGAPVAFSMQGTPVLYFYRKNLQGDVTGVYKGSTGALLVSYVYDAWGKVTATDEAGTTESANVLTYNPYLYRGYRYDSETGLYYLNSRYYDPETGRFINADGFVSTGQGILGNNMFAYCLNNPISLLDKDGNAPELWQAFVSVSSIVCGLLLSTTGVAAPIGATMVSAGTASLIMGSLTESSGGLYADGWNAGLLGGALSGFGVAYGGQYLVAASEKAASSGEVLSNMVKGYSVSYAFGVTGNMVSDALIEKDDYKFGKSLVGSLYSGIPNMIGALGYSASTVTTLAGNTAPYKTLAIGISASTQTVSDGLNYYLPYAVKKVRNNYMRIKQYRYLQSRLITELGW